MDGFADVMQ